MIRFNKSEKEIHSKQFPSSQIPKLVLCFKNMIEFMQTEIFVSLSQILKISLRIINDSDDNINQKSTEIEAIIKEKIKLHYFERKLSVDCKL